MRRDKTAARILLILSVVHAAVAAPAIVCERSPAIAEGTPASEKRGNSDGETSKDLYPVPQMDSNLPTTSGSPPQEDPPLKLETPPVHNDSPSTPGTPPLQNDVSSALGNPEVHNEPPARPEEPPQWQADWQHNDWRPTGEIVQGESSLELESEGPTVLGLPPKHEYLSSGSGEFDHVWRWLDNLPPLQEGTALKSESPPSSLWDDSEAPRAPPPAPAPAPETGKVSSDALKQGLKVLGGFGAVAGVSAGLAYGVYKLVKHHSHERYVSTIFHSSPTDI